MKSFSGECYNHRCFAAMEEINKPLYGDINWSSASELDLYNVARETATALAEVTRNNIILRREVQFKQMWKLMIINKIVTSEILLYYLEGYAFLS